jgi:hypothetical protein
LIAVHKKFGKVKLKTYPNYTLFSLFYYGFVRRIISIYPFYYLDYNKNKAREFLKEKYNWEYYGGHHHENLFTKFVMSYWLPVKYGIDKRKITLSAQVMSGEIKREEAVAMIAQPPFDESKLDETINFLSKKLDLTRSDFDAIMKIENKTYRDYPSYIFVYDKLLKLANPFLRIIFTHKPQSIYKAELIDNKKSA